MRTLVLTSKAVLFLLGAGLPLEDTWANPAGESIVAGSVDIQRRQDLMQIQATDGAIIDWHSGFNIASHETVEFIQPCSQCQVLNNDTTLNASVINGALLANGHVVIANPFGVWFGSETRVDVAHLTAAAGSISNEDFLAGRLHFTGLEGDVLNDGSIRAQNVALIGRQVANRGQIVSTDGSVWMLAGEEIRVGEWGSPIQISLGTPTGDAAAVDNDGTIDAGRGNVRMAAGDLLGLALRNRGTIRGGEIVLDGATGDVEVSGSLDTAGRGETGRGGQIAIAGERIALRGAVLDASGEAGGGQIEVGGHAHGTPRDLGNATQTRVDAESVLRADALERGDGGQVVVWADGSTRFHGEISARGGAQGGDGGFVETSGRDALDVTGARVDASTPAGEAGNWLLDPRDVEIVSSGEFGGEFTGIDPITFTPDGQEPLSEPATVSSETIVAALNTGTNVTIQTTSSAPVDQEGTITVSSEIATALPGGEEATLTLKADTDILVSESIEDTGSGALNVTLEADRSIFFGSPIAIPDGRATLEAGRGDDSGVILSFLVNEAAITAGQLQMTAAAGITNSVIDLATGNLTAAPFEISTPTLTATVEKGGLWIEQIGAQDLDIQSISTGSGGNATIENTGGGLHVQSIETEGLVTGETFVPGDVDLKSAGDLAVTGTITTDGGFVDLESVGELEVTGTITTDGGFVDLETTEQSITIGEEGTIDTRKSIVGSEADTGGRVGMLSASDIVIHGPVYTGGGSLKGVGTPSGEPRSTAEANNDVITDRNGVIDTRLLNPNDPGASPWSVGEIWFEAKDGDIRVATDLHARIFDLLATDLDASTTCETSALCFAANSGVSAAQPVLWAYSDLDTLVNSEIRLQAGNASSDTERAVDARNATFNGGEAGTSPGTFEITQTADLQDEILPDATAFGAGNLENQVYGITVRRAGTNDLSPNSGTLTLDSDAQKFEKADLVLTAGEKVILDFDSDPLELGLLRVSVDGDLAVDESFAKSVSAEDLDLRAAGDIAITKSYVGASNSLEVIAGRDVEQESGGLSIGPSVTLEAPTLLSLRGGNSGRGGVTFLDDVRLISDNIALEAGSGLFQEDLSKVELVVDGEGETLFEQVGTDRSFTIIQDASIATADLPRAEAFTEDIRRPPGHRLDGLNYALVSREGEILIDPAAPGLTDVAKLQGTNLTLIAEDGVSISTASPVEVNSAVVGGLGPFTVTPELADHIGFARKADGSDADGQLSFVSGAGPFDSEDPFNPAPPPDLTFQFPETGDLELRADQLTLSAGFPYVDNLVRFGQVVLPTDRLVFRNQHGDRHSAPDTFDFRQTNLVVSTDLPRAHLFGNAEGPGTSFGIEGYVGLLLESPASLAVPEGSKLVARAPLVQFAVINQDLDLGERELEIEAGDVEFSATGSTESGPARVLAHALPAGSIQALGMAIVQTGTIAGSELPTFEAWHGGEGPDEALYQLLSESGGVDLSGHLDRVAGSHLRLLLPSADAEISLGSGTLDVASLFGAKPGTLQLSGDGAGTIVRAENSIRLNSACVPTTTDSCTGPDEAGNLQLDGNLTLEAPSIALLAGHPSLIVPTGEPLPVVEIAPEVQFDLTSEDTSEFVIQQVGDLTDTTNNLPTPAQFVGPGISDIDLYTAQSYEGDITITNLAALDAQLTNLVAVSNAVHIEKATGSLGEELDNTTIQANRIVLEATTGSVDAANETLNLNLGANSSFEIRQADSFDPSQVDSGKLPEASQFILTSAIPIVYKVTSTAGQVVVDSSFGPSTAGSNLILQSGPGNAVEFKNSIDSGAQLESLSVNVDPDVLDTPIVLGGGDDPSFAIESRSDQVYGAAVELRSDARLVAGSNGNGSIVFTNDVTTDTPSDHTLTVAVDESVRFSGDIGETSARLESLEIEAFENSPTTSAVALFGPEEPGDPQATRVGVYTAGDIELFSAGRSAIPATATVSMQQTQADSTLENPDLRLDSANGSVLMGTHEKLSVPGALVIEAGEEARVGDLSALAMHVEAPTITLLRRGEGPVLHSDGSLGTDGGVDYVANTIRFTGAVGSTGAGQSPTFGLPDPFLVPDFVRTSNYPAAAINVNNTPATRSEFTVAGSAQVLDLQPLGASSADLAEAFWIPTPLPFLQAPPQQLVTRPARLIEIGMALLPTSVAEYQSRLHGAGILDDVDSGVRLASAPAWVSEARILPSDADRALAAYRRVLGPRRENAERIREVLQAALDDYRSLTGARRVVGFEFRRYLKNRPSSQFEAYVALQELDSLFLHQRRSGLVASEFQHVQEAWLEEITPDGITPAELSQAIFPSRYVRGSEILDVYGE